MARHDEASARPHAKAPVANWSPRPVTCSHLHPAPTVLAWSAEPVTNIVPLLPLLSQALEPVPESSNDHRAWASPHSLAPTDPHIETKVSSCQKSPFARRASPLALLINKIYRSERFEDDLIAAVPPTWDHIRRTLSRIS